MKLAKYVSDYDPNTILTLLRNEDGDIVIRVTGPGEMRLTSNGGKLHGKSWLAVTAAVDRIIHVLNLENSSPSPLTVEELRRMNGKPVWCTHINHPEGAWAIIRVTETYSSGWTFGAENTPFPGCNKGSYGSLWNAYREEI